MPKSKASAPAPAPASAPAPTITTITHYKYDDCGVKCRINPQDENDFQPCEPYCFPCGARTEECDCGKYKCGKWFNEKKGKFQGGFRATKATLQQKPSPQPVPPPPINIPLPLPLPLKLKPLIKWSGGKGDEIPQFEMHIPASYDTYIEPFVGGGALFFRLAPKKAVISDVHTELVDFYQNIGQGNAGEIFQFMEQHPNEEATYYDVRDNMVVANSLDRAKRFYYQRKTAFRGMLRYNKNGKFNIPFGRYKTINYSELANAGYETLLSRTTVLNNSFEHVFAEYNSEANFMFLDPPYDSEFTDYGYCQFGKNEHEQLAKCFKQTKIRCLMVIGKTEFIEGLYAGFIVGEYDKQYRFKLYGGRIGDEINTKHLIIKNY